MKNKKKYLASMAVEASILLPLFLFFLLNILSAMELYRLHSSALYSLWKIGREAACYAHITENAETTEALTDVYAGIKLEKVLNQDSTFQSVLQSKVFPVSLLAENPQQEKDIINIKLKAYAGPAFGSFGGRKIPICIQYYGHAWTGYDLEQYRLSSGDEEYVYITENGSVYHRKGNCSYLNPSIHTVASGVVDTKRNRDGEKYTRCPSCAPSLSGTLYITDYGECYHSSVDCSGLKRVIYQVRISEVGGRKGCSKCGGL